jgi:nitrogenase iron protein NifH
VTKAELKAKTVVEAEPDSEQAQVYFSLAQKIAAHEISRIPSPLTLSDLQSWAGKWSDRLLEQAEGTVSTGEAI